MLRLNWIILNMYLSPITGLGCYWPVLAVICFGWIFLIAFEFWVGHWLLNGSLRNIVVIFSEIYLTLSPL